METNLTLSAKIEALLFYKGEPVSFKSLVKSFDVSEEEVMLALKNLEENLAERGISLVVNDKEAMLGTHKEMSGFFEELRKEELTKELSRASLETLSIILYKKNVNRAEIDYIRGVNSGFILRNLQIRGLIEKAPDPKDSRTFTYSPTLELLSFMGISKISELHDFENVSQKLQEKVNDSKDENSTR